MEEQTGDTFVPQITEKIGEVVQYIPQDHLEHCTVEQTVKSYMPQITETISEIGQRTSQERLQQSTVEQALDSHVPQITDKNSEIGQRIPQGRGCNRPTKSFKKKLRVGRRASWSAKA